MNHVISLATRLADNVGEDTLDESLANPSDPVSTPEVGSTALEEPPALFPTTAPEVVELLNDTGNAELLIQTHGEDFRYVTDWGVFVVWDGLRWTYRLADTRMHEFSKDALSHWKAVCSDLMDGSSARAEAAQMVVAWHRTSFNHNKLRAMRKVAEHDERVSIGSHELDANPGLLGVINGVVNLRTGEFQEADPSDFLTKGANVEFDEAAGCPRWLRFLDDVMEGDDEMISYLKKLVGYCLTGDIQEQRLFFVYGYGANGKSTFLNVIQHLLGKEPLGYGSTVDVHALMVSKRSGSGPSPEIAKLQGSRLAVAQEVPEGERLDESLIKAVTGGDLITARKLYGHPFTFKPTHKVLISGNHKPYVRGTDEGIWRRIDLINFRRRFLPREQDKQLERRLLEELPGILNWAIEGCLEWQLEGLERPSRIEDDTAEYRRDQDVLQQWLDEECEKTASAWTSAQELYQRYGCWADVRREWVMPARRFNQKLEEKGYEKVRRSAGYGFDGLKLRY